MQFIENESDIFAPRHIHSKKKHAPTISSSTKKIVNLRSCALARGKDISPLGYSDIDSKEETKEGFHGNYIYIKEIGFTNGHQA